MKESPTTQLQNAQKTKIQSRIVRNSSPNTKSQLLQRKKSSHSRFQYQPRKDLIENGQKIISKKSFQSNTEITKNYGFINQRDINFCVEEKNVSIQNSAITKIKQDHNQFYLYWKKKANEYQQLNFQLNKENSEFRQQIECLKHRNKVLERKLSTASSYELMNQKNEKQINLNQSMENKGNMISKYYQNQILLLEKKLQQKQALITNQNFKLDKLSQLGIQNSKLRALIQKIDDKVSEESFLHDIKSSKGSYSKQLESKNTKAFNYSLTPIQRPNKNNLKRTASHQTQNMFSDKKSKSIVDLSTVI